MVVHNCLDNTSGISHPGLSSVRTLLLGPECSTPRSVNRLSVNVALVGLGQWGKNHLKVLSRLHREGLIEELILHDAATEYGQSVAKEFGLPFEPDFQHLLQNRSLDAIDIAASTEAHYPLGMKALQAEKDVLIEKPLAYNRTQCQELINAANDHSRILMVGHIFRYHPAIVLLRKLLDEEYFGEVYSIDIIRQAIRVPRKDMGVLYALAIHDVDLACYLFGQSRPKSIFALAQSFYSDHPDENTVLLLEYMESKYAKIESSWLNPVAKKRRSLELIGSRRSAAIDFLTPNELRLSDEHIDVTKEGTRLEESSERIEKTGEGMPLDLELEHFLTCVQQRTTPLTDGFVGQNAVEILEGAYQSIRTGTPYHFEKRI